MRKGFLVYIALPRSGTPDLIAYAPWEKRCYRVEVKTEANLGSGRAQLQEDQVEHTDIIAVVSRDGRRIYYSPDPGMNPLIEGRL